QRKRDLSGGRGRAQRRDWLVGGAVENQHLVAVLLQDVEAVAGRVGQQVHVVAGQVHQGSPLIGIAGVDQQADRRRKVHGRRGSYGQRHDDGAVLILEGIGIDVDLDGSRGRARIGRNGHARHVGANLKIGMAAPGIGDRQVLGDDRPVAETTQRHQVGRRSRQPVILSQLADRQHRDAAVGDRVHRIRRRTQHGASHDVLGQRQGVPHGQVVGVHDGEHRRGGGGGRGRGGGGGGWGGGVWGGGWGGGGGFKKKVFFQLGGVLGGGGGPKN